MDMPVMYAYIGEGLVDEITEFFQDGLIGCAENIYEVWNACVTTAQDLITVTPYNYANGAGWNAMLGVRLSFVAIGTSLLTMFFLIGFIRESINIRQELTVNQIVKLFFRLIFGNALISSSLMICRQVFTSMAAFGGLISTRYTDLEMADGYVNAVSDANIAEAIMGMLVAVIAIIVSLALGGTLLYVMYFRFYRLIIITPIAPIAFSTVAGGSGIAQTAVSYLKALLSFSGEVVLIALALNLSSAILNGGFSFGTYTSNTMMKLIIYPAEAILNMAVVVGSVKGAEPLLRRIANL